MSTKKETEFLSQLRSEFNYVADEKIKGFTALDIIERVFEQVPDNEESLLKQNKELLDWKESSMQVMADLDLQEIGKVLNLKLGSSISEQTLPAIKKLKADKEELLEMLDRVRLGEIPYEEIKSLIQKHKK